MFLSFLLKWLKYRYVNSLNEVRTFHRGEVEQIPEGYYAVVTVELKPLPEPSVYVETMSIQTPV